MKTIGFDNDKYILEFGGKLFDDFHAARVLPGFLPDTKVKMLLKLKDSAEIIIVISADDIEKNKIRGDLGITYDLDALRLIDAFRSIGLYVGSVVISHFKGQPAAINFSKRLDALGIKVYRHYIIPPVLLSSLPRRVPEAAKWQPVFHSFITKASAE